MNYTDTKTLYPNEEKSVGFDKESLEQLKNINERLDNMSNDIADINDKVDGLDNQVVTENLQAAQASLQEASVNELSAQSASVSELEAGNATANKVTSRGEVKGAQLEISGTSHLKDDVTVDGKVTSESVRAGSVTTDHLIADEMDVTDFTVDELSVTEKATIKEEEVETSVVTTQTVSSQTVESQEVTSQNVVSQDVTSQEVTNQDVENAVIEDAEIKALTSGGNTFNFNSDNSIAITEDSYIRIKPEINSEVRLILKTALNATILAAAISVDVPAADKANVHLVYSNTEALSDIYFDVNGNLWLKLETGVRGTLYFMQGGVNVITPETDSVVNPAFDPSAEGTLHYESGTHGDIFITSKVIFNSEVQIDKDVTLKKDAEISGDVHIEGNLDVDGILTIGSLSAERARYLGRSDDVTADDDGNFQAKDGTFNGDVTATGEISSTGDITAGGDVNAVGDVTGTNGEFSGTVKAEGGFEGDLTGDVTGDVTGNVTGDVTGNVTGNVTGDVNAEDVSTDTLETTGNASVGEKLSVGSLNDATKYKYLYEGYRDGNVLIHDAEDVAACIFTKRPLSSNTVFVSNEAELISALTDSSISRIAIIADITINEDVTLSGSKQIYGTPKPNAGSKMTLCFKKLTGTSTIQFFDLNLVNANTSWSMECDFNYLYLDNCGLSGVKYKQIYGAVDCTISGRVGYSSTYLNPTSDYPMKIYSAKNCDFNYLWITDDYFWELKDVQGCTFKEIIFRYAPSSVATPTNVYIKISNGSYAIEDCIFNFKVYQNSNVVNPIEYLILADISSYYTDDYRSKYHIFERCNFKFDLTDVSSSGRPPLCLFKFRNSSTLKNLGLAKNCNFLISGTRSYSYQQTVLAVFNFGINRDVSFENNSVNFNSNGCNACIFSTSEAQGAQAYSNWVGGIRNNKFMVPRSVGVGTEIVKMITGSNFIIIGFTGNKIEYSEYNSFSCINGIKNNIIGLLSPDELVNDSANTTAVSASNNAYNYNNYYSKG